ncbi:virulence factor TspB C-terminal domain-related protein [Neisseria polysaccharea]|uniref:virulence factor TspB C-terminal domain-related protein n=1 Tax=Neisseria polysaccharea TaxID=489 RepID=UPI000D31119F
MKNNAPRNSIFNCCRPISVLLLGVIVPYAQVIADVPPPPPAQHQNAGFPSAQKLEQMGYNRETGVWKVQTNPTGKPTVSSGGGQITGTQGQRVTVTDAYGNKANVNTQVTQRVNIGRVEAAIGGTLAGLSAAGGAIGSDYANWAYRDIKAGSWGDAARNTVGALLSGLAELDITGLGSGINNFLDKTGIRSSSSGEQLGQIAAQQQQAQEQAQKSGDFRGAVSYAVAAKAAKVAGEVARAEEFEKEQLKPKNENGKVLKPFLIRFKEVGYRYAANGNGGEVLEEEPKWTIAYLENNGGDLIYGYFYDQERWGETVNINAYGFKTTYKFKYKNTPRYMSNGVYKGYYDIGLSVKAYSPDSKGIKIAPDPNPKDFQLTQKEILDILKSMLENQQTNHSELMNQLAKMGNVVPDSTTSIEFTPATATTAPYTPSGSSTPQQTQITINKDGSVTTKVIPRPDLVPNSPQAPTRSPLIPNNPSSPITPDNQNTPDMPEKDKLPQENTAYEEPDIPTQTVDLDFKPADIFSVDGVCPEPKSVDFGMFGQHEFSYDPLCDFARKLRPVLILITIVSCSFFVYSSLKD